VRRDKRNKFIELAEKRVNRLLKEIQLVGNLSNRNNYVFTHDDVRRIFSAIETELKMTKKRFESSGPGSGSKFKL
jgi:hypothetical protein